MVDLVKNNLDDIIATPLNAQPTPPLTQQHPSYQTHDTNPIHYPKIILIIHQGIFHVFTFPGAF